MVGVPHSTGCARCRERRIKVRITPPIAPSRPSPNARSATKQPRTAPNAAAMAVPVRGTSASSASKTKAQPWSAGINPPLPPPRPDARCPPTPPPSSATKRSP
ncbi:hypothetical protein BDV59DRAFT_174338 [Aspergillus ambiguus]|uniref:uncharacterized protein n=1 Tax=Aspergillus ambiguus TaxID=176160 RepID=UPI003CCE13E0